MAEQTAIRFITTATCITQVLTTIKLFVCVACDTRSYWQVHFRNCIYCGFVLGGHYVNIRKGAPEIHGYCTRLVYTFNTYTQDYIPNITFP